MRARPGALSRAVVRRVRRAGELSRVPGCLGVNDSPNLSGRIRVCVADCAGRGEYREGKTSEVDGAKELVVSALGARVVVRVSGDAAHPFVDDLWQRWRRCLADLEVSDDSSRAARQLHYTLDNAADDAVAALRRRITIDVTAAALDHCRGEVLTLHAAGLEVGEVSYVFVGPSGAGKSTLAAGLGRRFGYAGDEAVAVDADNRLIAFPKPLSLFATPAGDKAQVSPDSLDLREAHATSRLAGIFLLDRRQDAPRRATVTPVPLSDAIVALARQASYLPSLEGPLQRLAGLARAVGVHRISYRESSDLAAVLEHAPAADSTIWDWQAPRDEHVLGTTEGGPAVRRVEVRDAIQDAEGTIVLLRDTDLHVLSPLGSVIWELSSQWLGFAELEAELARITGTVPPAGLVEERVTELAASGLVTIRR